jgi:hypothetical protein
MISLVRMLHILALNVLKFNLVILKSLLHELVQLIQGLIPLFIITLGPFLDLVVVHHVIVRARVTILNLKTILRLLFLVTST